MASKYLQKFPIPAGFQQILSDFTKEVLRDQPTNIIQYAAQYFQMLEKGKKLQFNSKYNVKKDDKKYELSYNPKNAQDITKKASNITQKINQRTNQQQHSAPTIQKQRVTQNHIQQARISQQTHVHETHPTSVIGTEKTVTGQQTGNYLNHLSNQVAQHQYAQQNQNQQGQQGQQEMQQKLNTAFKDAISQSVAIIFQKYDTNKSGFLESKEINNFVNDVITDMNQGIVPSKEQIQEFVRQVDNDHDGKISRAELQDFVGQLMGLY